MTADLIYLAMNPNLTQEEFTQLSTQMMKNRKELIELMAAEAKKMPPDLRMQYIAQCLPMIL